MEKILLQADDIFGLVSQFHSEVNSIDELIEHFSTVFSDLLSSIEGPNAAIEQCATSLLLSLTAECEALRESSNDLAGIAQDLLNTDETVAARLEKLGSDTVWED